MTPWGIIPLAPTTIAKIKRTKTEADSMRQQPIRWGKHRTTAITEGLFWIQLAALLCSILVVGCNPAPSLEDSDSIERTASYQDSVLLERAWQLPVAKTYPNPIVYQDNRAFCGPATVINLFRSLGIGQLDQNTVFDRANVSYWKARFLGLTLDELAGLIRSNTDLKVSVLRNLTVEAFRAEMRHVNDPAYRYLINFNRQPLFGWDVGHFSPLGGYLVDVDLVFVLDVMEKYQPFLVSTERLYAAMDTVDSETGQKRGLLRVQAVSNDVLDVGISN